MKNNMSITQGSAEAMKVTAPSDDIESAEAAYEFATLIEKESAHRRTNFHVENYEVRPCTRVRGYTLKLPVLGWRLWYPTATAATTFARRVASSYRAECFVYDAAGQLDRQHVQN